MNKVNLFRRICCRLLFAHSYRFVSVKPFIDTSYGSRTPSIFYAKVCRICGRHESGSMYGCPATKVEEMNAAFNQQDER